MRCLPQRKQVLSARQKIIFNLIEPKKIYFFISQQESITLELITVEDGLKFFILPSLNTVESITVKDDHSIIDRRSQ